MHSRAVVRMSRQIADYFEAYPEAEAVAEVRGHLRKFWDPRMREQLREVYASRPELLHPLVHQALAQPEKQVAD